MSPDEQHTIALCIRKDRKATELFYRQHYAYLYRICYIYLRNEDDCRDTVLVSFMKIFNHLHEFDAGKGDLKSWLRRITVNGCLDLIRKTRRHLSEEIGEDTQYTEDENAGEKLQLGNIISYIETMGSPMKEIIKLFAIEGYSHKEIAEMLGITEGNSRFLLSRARKLLDAQFRKEDIHG